ncbi:unnamed protein product [Discula destructiva]
MAHRTRSRLHSFPYLTLALLMLSPTVALHSVLAHLPPLLRYLVLIYTLTTNAATLVVYRHDKHAAVACSRRVSETTLHLWALLGGWPAAFVAQRVLRHKTRKRAFKAVFWGIVALEQGVCWTVLGIL